jgi:hypothetical protein
MRRAIAVLIGILTVGLCFAPICAQGQGESAKEANPATAKAGLVQPYRLDFSFNELADGKIINSRRYSMNLTAGESNEIKIGTRVPVATISSPSMPSPTQFQYIDVGTNIWSQLREHGDEWLLVVRSDVSNLDLETREHGGTQPPVVRQIKINGDTLLIVGKPIVIGSVDDPNSKRQFQLEVTVTKLR